VGLLLHPRPTGAVVSSCSVSGAYALSGFALGDTEVGGSLVFTPNGPCTGGTFIGSVTVKVDGSPATPFTPSGTYVVAPDTSMTITNTGGVTVTLQGIASQVVNDLANAIQAVGDVGGAINVGLTLTRAVLTVAVGPPGPPGAVGTLAGEVTGPPTSNVVSNAVSANTATAIVRRDGAGSFSAGALSLAGDLNLPATSSSAAGVLTLNGDPFLHAFGSGNTFLGDLAGNFTMTGSGSNTAVGQSALKNNTTGAGNVVVGGFALFKNTTGVVNTAVGSNALNSNTTGTANTAVGTNALVMMTTGTNNSALGAAAGSSLTTGSDNIYIGSSDSGAATESATIRIGTGGTQTKTFIAGIRGVTTTNINAIPVLIDSSGQLGTVSSSRRVKTDIEAMGAASRPLLRLRPVSFRYTAHAGQGPREYGLIAEEVADTFPDLVVYDQTGQPETVRYHELPALLLNELQQQHRRLVEQAQTIATLQQAVTGLQARLAAFEQLLAVQASR